MVKCRHCGNEVEEGDIFCVKCGNKVDGSKDSTPIKEEYSPISSPKTMEMEEMANVYHSTSRTTKAKLVFYGIIILIIITLGVSLYSLFNEVTFNPKSNMKVCPFECCSLENESIFLEKKCSNQNAKCINNSCILDECPFECCDGIEFVEKTCSKDMYCYNYQCEKKECPFECCLPQDNYLEQKCTNNGNCVNNECILATCPEEFECCLDEIEYEDKACGSGQSCIDRTCKVESIETAKKYTNTLVSLFKSLFA